MKDLCQYIKKCMYQGTGYAEVELNPLDKLSMKGLCVHDRCWKGSRMTKTNSMIRRDKNSK